MHRVIMPALLLTLAIAPNVSADGVPPWDFEYTADGGPINDNWVQWYQLLVPDALEVVYMELEIAGLTHNAPGDLNVFLLDPFGDGIEVMDDNGDQVPLGAPPAVLVFSDKGDPLPVGNAPLVDGTRYEPLGPGMFSQYNWTTYGVLHPGTWILVMTDDSPGEGGQFETFTLRGTVVPEPVTLSMLALGAVVLLRRKRA